MENNIQKLIKNALEENIVQFKEQANNVLYSKVSNRLKQEYVNVSKKLFKNINEVALPEPTLFNQPEPMGPEPQSATDIIIYSDVWPSNFSWPENYTYQDNKPPNIKDYFPPDINPHVPPKPEDYPGLNKEQFQRLLELWQKARDAYFRHKSYHDSERRRRISAWDEYYRKMDEYNRGILKKPPTRPGYPDPRGNVGGGSGSPGGRTSSPPSPPQSPPPSPPSGNSPDRRKRASLLD